MEKNNIVDLSDVTKVKKLAGSWGWTVPSEEILALARKSIQAQDTLSGQLLVDWGQISEETRDQYLKTQPKGVKTLTYFGEKEPTKILPYVEQALALKNGYPFYESLQILNLFSAVMDLPDVLKSCKARDAVLMAIEERTPVLVFSAFDALLKFSTMGHAEKSSDAVLKELKGRMPKLAVGSRDEISSILKMHETEQSDPNYDSNSRAWIVRADDPSSTEQEREIARIFDHGLSVGATDVWIKPLRNGTTEVYLRKSGTLIEPFKRQQNSMIDKNAKEGFERASAKKTVFLADMSDKITNLLVSKSSAGDAGRMREPCDGQINYRSMTAEAFMRLSFIPLNHPGDYRNLRSVSVRLFKRTETTMSLKEQNLPEAARQYLMDAISAEQGLILFSGPTNSGKSSSIAALLGEHYLIYGDKKKRLSVEDPIERFLTGICQINVPMHLEESLRFSTVLKSINRHDPDLCWIGEVRDEESADFCVKFSAGGHLSLSTIHANDSIGGFDMLVLRTSGHLRNQVADSMSISVAQRLIRRICPHCSTPDCVPNDEEIRRFNKTIDMLGEEELRDKLPQRVRRLKENPGCNDCDEGYAGEIPICEILPFTRAVRDAAQLRLQGVNIAENRAIMAKARPLTLLQSGLQRVNDGETDLMSIFIA